MPSNESFIKIAISVSALSKCTRKKVGAVIVDKDYRVISVGYNGTPKGVENVCEENGQTKATVIHAELNAILFAKTDLTDCKLFVTMSPCLHCSSLIIQTGITEVYYLEQYRDTAGIDFLMTYGIKIQQCK